MIYSEDRKFLFIHNPRTGGTSLEHAIFKALALDHTRLRKEIMQFIPKKHMSARIASRLIPICFWEQLFRFGFVRNPWDRYHSQYYIGLQKPLPGGPPAWVWPDNTRTTFRDYILDWPSGQESMLAGDDGEPLVEIFRYEDRAAALAEISGKIKLDCIDETERRLPTTRPNFMEEYDQEMIDHVATIDRWTINRFGYDYAVAGSTP